jgi:hypothetical protein
VVVVIFKIFSVVLRVLGQLWNVGNQIEARTLLWHNTVPNES